MQNRVTVSTDANGVAIGATITLPTAGGGRAGRGMSVTAQVGSADTVDDLDSDPISGPNLN